MTRSSVTALKMPRAECVSVVLQFDLLKEVNTWVIEVVPA